MQGSFGDDPLHNLLEDVDARFVIAQQRQSSADLPVALHQRSTRETLGSVQHRDSARFIGVTFPPHLWVVPTSHDPAGHTLEPTNTPDPLHVCSGIPRRNVIGVVGVYQSILKAA
jgi:hypothetical protein